MTVPPPQSIVTIMETKVNKGGSITKWYLTNWRAILAEIISTSLLILIGCMSCIPIDYLPYQNPLYAALTFGFVVMFNIQIFGHISGAHMNPSVSLAAAIYGTLSIPLAIAYILAQCVGAILGYGVLYTIAPIDLASEGICVTTIHHGLNVYQAIGVEIALTSCLNFMNCAVWDPVNKLKTEALPLKFALAIAGLSFAGGPLTGASMNPARSLGPVTWTGLWKDHWVYWIGPVIGGIVPTIIYKSFFLKKEKIDN